MNWLAWLLIVLGVVLLIFLVWLLFRRRSAPLAPAGAGSANLVGSPVQPLRSDVDTKRATRTAPEPEPEVLADETPTGQIPVQTMDAPAESTVEEEPAAATPAPATVTAAATTPKAATPAPAAAASPAAAAAAATPATSAPEPGAYPGSAKPLAGGASPSEDYTIKGNADSMLFHTKESPYYSRTKAEVWFANAADAEAAGFTAWNKRRTQAGEIKTGPYPGSALPLKGGDAPSGDYTIKGNEDSMLYHTKESPFFSVTTAEVWFRSTTDAEKAGFHAWKS